MTIIENKVKLPTFSGIDVYTILININQFDQTLKRECIMPSKHHSIIADELLSEIVNIPANPNCTYSKTVAERFVSYFLKDSAFGNDFINGYIAYVDKTLLPGINSDIKAELKLATLNKSLNISYFIHFHIIKKHPSAITHRLKLKPLIDLWCTLSHTYHLARDSFDQSPSLALTWLLTVNPILESTYLEFSALIESVITNNNHEIPEAFATVIKSNVSRIIFAYADIHCMLSEMYYKIGKTKEGAIHHEISERNINEIEKNRKALQTYMSAAEITLLIYKFRESFQTLKSYRPMNGALDVYLKEHLKLIKKESNEFHKKQPEVPFESETIPQADSSSSSNNILYEINEVVEFIKNNSVTPFLYLRVKVEIADKLKTTFRILNRLMLAENHKYSEKNLEASISLCIQWRNLFAVSYTDDTQPIVDEWTKIIQTLVKYIHAAYSRIPDYFEHLLFEIEQLGENVDISRIDLLSHFPNPAPTNFQHRFHEYIINHPRFKIENELYIQESQVDSERIFQLQNNVNIIEFLLKNIRSQEMQDDQVPVLIHILWKTFASINHTTAILLNKNIVPEETSSIFLEKIRQNYRLMLHYAPTYERLLQNINNIQTSAVSFSAIRSIKPNYFSAVFSIMTAYTDYAICEWYTNNITLAQNAILIAYEHTKPLIDGSLILSEVEKLKVRNYIKQLRQLTLSIYAPGFQCEEFNNFIQQASEKIPLQKILITQIITLPDNLESFWSAYENYLNFTPSFETILNSNQTMFNIIAEHKINVLYYFLKHVLDKSSPFYIKTLQVLWKTCQQRYANANTALNITPPSSENQRTKAKFELEQHKSYIKDLIPYVQNLNDKSFNLQIAALKKSFNELLPFSDEELDRMSTFRKGKGKGKGKAKTEPSRRQFVTKQHQKSSDAPKKPTEIKAPRPLVVPRGHVTTSYDTLISDTPWLTPGQPKATIKSSSTSSVQLSTRTLPKRHITKSSSPSLKIAATSSSSTGRPFSKKAFKKPTPEGTLSKYKGILEPKSIFPRPISSTVEDLTQGVATLNLSSVSIANTLKVISDNKTISFSPSVSEFIPPTFCLDEAGCSVVDINPNTFSISLDIIEICYRFHNIGYKAFIAGGLIRDTLLGILPNDVDIITNCPREKAYKLFNYFGKLSDTREDLYLLHPGIDILSSSSKNLTEEALKRDLTCNALFYCPIEKKLFDPLNCFSSLFEPNLRLVGNAYARLIEDPVRILRIIRFSHSLDKKIPSHTEDIMKIIAPSIAKLPWGVRANSIMALFLRNFNLAIKNYNYLLKNKILPHLFSQEENEKSYYPDNPSSENRLNRYWHYTLRNIYLASNPTFANLSAFDQIIALILFIRLKGYQIRENVEFIVAKTNTITLIENLFFNVRRQNILQAIEYHLPLYDVFDQIIMPESHVVTYMYPHSISSISSSSTIDPSCSAGSSQAASSSSMMELPLLNRPT